MDLLKKQWKKFDFYIIFTIAFIPVAIFLHNQFADAGMNFVRRTDGIAQHFNAFLYDEKYLRGILSGIIKGGGIHAPLMNYTIGQGADVLMTLSGYDFLNPVVLVSIILFRKDLFFAYEFMVLANLYLAGIAFGIYCRTMKKGNAWSVSGGALIYAFCGYALHFGIWAPIFMSGMIMMPLIFASVEVFFERKKCLPLLLSVFVSLMISYFNFFMNVVFLAVYILIRLIPCPASEIKEKIIMILKAAGVTITGGLLSAVWLLPSVIGVIMNNGAYQADVGYKTSRIFYPPDYYLKMIEYFPYSAYDAGFLNFLGFAPVAMISLWLLFSNGKKEHNKLRVAVCVGFAAMSIPLVGSFLNGFRYVGNRWTYSFAFVVALAFVAVSEDLHELTFKQTMLVLVGTSALIALWYFDEDFKEMQYVPHMILVLTMAVVLLCARPYFPKKLVPAALLVLVIFSHFANIVVQYGRDYKGEVYEFCSADEGYGIYAKYSTARVANTADDELFYRVEMQEERPNTEGFNNVHGTTEYYSVIDGNVRDYYDKLQLTSRPHLTQMYGTSGSRALLDLASVRYFTLPDEEAEAYVPFGFDESGDCVYENSYYLPPAYLYDSYMTQEDFLSLNPVDRQQAMIQAALLDKTPQNAAAVIPQKRAVEVEYTVDTDSVYWENGWMSTEKEDGELTLCFEPQPNCELYVWFDNMQLDRDMTNRDITVTGGYSEGDEFEGMVTKSVLTSSPKYAYYVNREGLCFNLGYSEDGYNCAKITLAGPSNYSCDGVHVLAVPMSDGYVDDIEKLRGRACPGIVIGDDRIYGTLESPGDSILQLSVPYSRGWKAKVDGKKARVLRSNLMYTAIELSPGAHEVKLKYCTPGLKPGLVISLLTLGGIIAVPIVRKKRGQ